MNQRNTTVFLLVFVLNFPVLFAQAQETGNLDFSVGIDTYYGYDFNEPENNSRQYVTQAARHNEFNLNWGFIKANYQDEWIRGNLAFHTGTYVVYNYAPEPVDLVKLIAEANAGLRLKEGIWIDVGIMPSHIGYESTFSFNNEMYTHAFMSDLTPYFSTGIQLSAAISERIDFNFVVLNGWQNIVETNNAKSVGLRFNYRPVEGLELNYSNYFGNESTNPSEPKHRFFNCFYAKYKFSDKWHGVVMIDYGIQEKSTSNEKGNIFAALLIADYKLSPVFDLAGRIEYFNDPDEFLVSTGTPGGFNNTNIGLCFGYQPVDYARLRFESRYYTSTDEIYWAGENESNNTLLLVGSLALNLHLIR